MPVVANDGGQFVLPSFRGDATASNYGAQLRT
jgi:hypothetical protein